MRTHCLVNTDGSGARPYVSLLSIRSHVVTSCLERALDAPGAGGNWTRSR